MDRSWEGFLDIIELAPEVRKRANLDILIEFPSGYPKNILLIELFKNIQKVYGSSNCTIGWFTQTSDPSISNLNTKTIDKDKINFVQKLWLRLAGQYIVFLPAIMHSNKFRSGDEEELIGEILVAYGHLLIKTPDGEEVLHLYLDK